MNFNTINHTARTALGLDLVEYCLADSVFHLGANPKSNTPGWSNASRQYFSDFLAVSKRSIINKINHLEELNLIERSTENEQLLRVTDKWYDAVIVTKNKGANSAPPMQKVHSSHADSAPPPMQTLHLPHADSAPIYRKIISKEYISKDIGAKPFVNDLNKTLQARKTQLVEEMQAEEMHLFSIGRIYPSAAPKIKAMIEAWAKENEATEFNSTNHKRNSFKNFVKQSQQKSSGGYKQPETSTVMAGKLLVG